MESLGEAARWEGRGESEKQQVSFAKTAPAPCEKLQSGTGGRQREREGRARQIKYGDSKTKKETETERESGRERVDRCSDVEKSECREALEAEAVRRLASCGSGSSEYHPGFVGRFDEIFVVLPECKPAT